MSVRGKMMTATTKTNGYVKGDVDYDTEYIPISQAMDKFGVSHSDFWIVVYKHLLPRDRILRVGSKIFISTDITHNEVKRAVKKLEEVKRDPSFPSLDYYESMEDTATALGLTRARLYQYYNEGRYAEHFLKVGGQLFANQMEIIRILRGPTLDDLKAHVATN